MKTVLGIDPGLSGALAFLGDGEAVLYDMPVQNKGKGGHEIDMPALVALLRDLAPGIVVIERQQTRTRDGKVQAFTTGLGFGALRMACVALGLPHELPTPQAWKKAMLAGETPDENPKVTSLRVARRLFPLADLGPKKDAGRAEALLIAEYGRRQAGGGNLT